MIPKKDLKKHSYYIGSGRGSHVALWDGGQFTWPAMQMDGCWSLDAGAHYEDGGCFCPMEEILEKYPTVAQLDEMKREEKRKQMMPEDIWKVLEQHCGAKNVKDNFIRQVREALDRHDEIQFRFIGDLGSGGTISIDMDGRARVSCYREDETPERRVMLENANRKLQRLSGR